MLRSTTVVAGERRAAGGSERGLGKEEDSRQFVVLMIATSCFLHAATGSVAARSCCGDSNPRK